MARPNRYRLIAYRRGCSGVLTQRTLGYSHGWAGTSTGGSRTGGGTCCTAHQAAARPRSSPPWPVSDAAFRPPAQPNRAAEHRTASTTDTFRTAAWLWCSCVHSTAIRRARGTVWYHCGITAGAMGPLAYLPARTNPNPPHALAHSIRRPECPLAAAPHCRICTDCALGSPSPPLGARSPPGSGPILT